MAAAEKSMLNTGRLTGAFVFLASLVVYITTIAPTQSFWDCGEFIACSYTLSVMHPPGAPLYMLISRLMTMLPVAADIGLRVNLFSAFVSAATVFFTYLTIVQLIRRWRGPAVSPQDKIILYGSAALGALAFAFTDSQWFNAVEAEVYALSMLFTAAVVWLALYWGERSRRAGNLLLMLFIFYLFGLATGVHLLNMLAFPFVLLIAYFHDNRTVRRLLSLIFIQAAVPMVLYILIYHFDPGTLDYNMLMAHQEKAGNFLKIFGYIWISLTLLYTIYQDYEKHNKTQAFFSMLSVIAIASVAVLLLRDILIVKILLFITILGAQLFLIKYSLVAKLWWSILALVLIGYSTYLLIYVRANLGPPINENDPSTMQGMMDYLARKQYGSEDMLLTFFHRKANFWNYQIQMMYTRYFGWQFIGKGIKLDVLDRITKIISFRGLYGLPFLVGLWGAVHHFIKDWKRAVAVLVLFLLTGYAIIIYLNQPDPQPRERDYSYVGSFFAFALWIGIGAAGLLETLAGLFKKRRELSVTVSACVLLILITAVPIRLLAFNYHTHDRSGNYAATDYAYNTLASCEENAIIFTNGDNDTFPFWYLQEVEGYRKDVRVVNLSLLNTPWYIKQLRDFEPKIPIRLKDSVIDGLLPRAWQTTEIEIPVGETIREELSKLPLDSMGIELQDKITLKISPTINEGGVKGIRVQDMMVLRIIQEVRWKRPVYFAVTVPEENKPGLSDYLRMDGLVNRLMPYQGESIQPDILETLLRETYRYRNLKNPDVYFNLSTIRLLQNYRLAYMQLIRYHLDRGDREKALELYHAMMEQFPEETLPYPSQRLAILMADLRKRVGEPVDFAEIKGHLVAGTTESRDELLLLAGYYIHVFKAYDEAEKILLRLVAQQPSDVQSYFELYKMYETSRQYGKAKDLLESWLQRNPSDEGAGEELVRIDSLIAAFKTAN